MALNGLAVGVAATSWQGLISAGRNRGRGKCQPKFAHIDQLVKKTLLRSIPIPISPPHPKSLRRLGCSSQLCSAGRRLLCCMPEEATGQAARWWPGFQVVGCDRQRGDSAPRCRLSQFQPTVHHQQVKASSSLSIVDSVALLLNQYQRTSHGKLNHATTMLVDALEHSVRLVINLSGAAVYNSP